MSSKGGDAKGGSTGKGSGRKVPKKTIFVNLSQKKDFLKIKASAAAKRAADARKKAEKAQKIQEVESVPRSMVFNRGTVGPELKRLLDDMKTVVMRPYTAMKLKVPSSIGFEEVKKIAQQIYTTHFLIFFAKEFGTMLKIMRLPQGPSLTFNVLEYTPIAETITYLKENNIPHITPDKQLLDTPPIVILNGFNSPAEDSEDRITPNAVQLKLVAATFQNMFPPIDVKNFNVDSVNNRALLFNYNADTDTIDWRQYYIRKDKDKVIKNKFKIQLKEIGPRMVLKLDKIEEGLNDGEVLYHSRIKKSEEEIEAMRQKHAQKKKEKEERKKEQEENVQRKVQEKQEKKQKKRKDTVDKREAAQNKLLSMIENTDIEAEKQAAAAAADDIELAPQGHQPQLDDEQDVEEEAPKQNNKKRQREPAAKASSSKAPRPKKQKK